MGGNLVADLRGNVLHEFAGSDFVGVDVPDFQEIAVVDDCFLGRFCSRKQNLGECIGVECADFFFAGECAFHKSLEYGDFPFGNREVWQGGDQNGDRNVFSRVVRAGDPRTETVFKIVQHHKETRRLPDAE